MNMISVASEMVRSLVFNYYNMLVKVMRSIDNLSYTYLVCTIVIFFPIIFRIDLNYRETEMMSIMRDPTVQLYAVAALSACVPMIFELFLDFGYCWKKGFVFIRLLSLVTMCIYCAMFLSLNNPNYVASDNFADAVVVVEHWQKFTIIFAICWMLDHLDTRLVFQCRNVSSVVILFTFAIISGFIGDIYPMYGYVFYALSGVFEICFYTTTCLLAWLWLYRVTMSYRKFTASWQEWLDTLTYKDYTCGVLCVLIIVVSPIWEFLPYWGQTGNADYSDVVVSASYYKTNILLRMFMVMCMTILPGRLIRLSMVEEVSNSTFKTSWVEYISHEMRTPIGIISMGLELTKNIVREGTLDKDDLLNTLMDLQVPCDTATDLLDQLLYLELLEKNKVVFHKKALDPFHFLRVAVRPLTNELVERGIDMRAILLNENIYFDVRKLKIDVDMDRLGTIVRKILKPLMLTKSLGDEICIEMEVIVPSNKVRTKKSDERMVSILKKYRSVTPFLLSDLKLQIRIPTAQLSKQDQYFLNYDDMKFKREAHEGKGSSGISIWIGKHILRRHKGRMFESSSSEGVYGCTFEIPFNLDEADMNCECDMSMHSHLDADVEEGCCILAQKMNLLDRVSFTLLHGRAPAAAVSSMSTKSQVSVPVADPNTAATARESTRRAVSRKTPRHRSRQSSLSPQDHPHTHHHHHAIFDELPTKSTDQPESKVEAEAETEAEAGVCDPGPRNTLGATVDQEEDDVLEEKEVSLRLLVVDDSALTRKILIKVMLSLGHTCTEAVDGSVAVELMRKAIETGTVYDAILMDNEMPVMKGRDAVRHIRAMGYRGRIFGVTGNVLQTDIDDFRENGADLVILKPMTIEKFNSALLETTSTVDSSE